METIKMGSRGKSVVRIQRLLHLMDDGIFGVATEEGVKEWQKENGIKPTGMVDAATWCAMFADADEEEVTRKSKRVITEIIVHCTATPEGRDYTVDQIRKQHKAQGWSDIGYHYVIYRDGSLHEGRDIDIAGAHCQGHNSHSIGVVYVGGCDVNMKPKDTRTEAQKKELTKLLKALLVLYPKATIHGHYEFANKACPSFNVSEYKNL